VEPRPRPVPTATVPFCGSPGGEIPPGHPAVWALGTAAVGSPPPLCMMARWNSPRALGADCRPRTETAPADWPNTVTLPGSPPNASAVGVPGLMTGCGVPGCVRKALGEA